MRQLNIEIAKRSDGKNFTACPNAAASPNRECLHWKAPAFLRWPP